MLVCQTLDWIKKFNITEGLYRIELKSFLKHVSILYLQGLGNPQKSLSWDISGHFPSNVSILSGKQHDYPAVQIKSSPSGTVYIKLSSSQVFCSFAYTLFCSLQFIIHASGKTHCKFITLPKGNQTYCPIIQVFKSNFLAVLMSVLVALTLFKLQMNSK